MTKITAAARRAITAVAAASAALYAAGLLDASYAIEKAVLPTLVAIAEAARYDLDREDSYALADAALRASNIVTEIYDVNKFRSDAALVRALTDADIAADDLSVELGFAAQKAA